MSVELKKGQIFELCDVSGAPYKNLTFGLGWDAADKKDEDAPKESNILKRGIDAIKQMYAAPADPFDCDASVLMLKEGKIGGIDDIVFYDEKHRKHASGAVEHMGDNRTGDGEGDDEEIVVHPAEIPVEYDRLVFVVTIFESDNRKQNFGMINNAFIRIVDNESKSEICRFDLTKGSDDDSSLIFGELCLVNGVWKFKAIGDGTPDTSILEVTRRYH